MKALLNTARRTCLYVKTFDLPHGQFPQAGVSAVFEHARRSTPCIVAAVMLRQVDSLREQMAAQPDDDGSVTATPNGGFGMHIGRQIFAGFRGQRGMRGGWTMGP